MESRFGRRPMPRKEKRKEDKCRIVLKKKKDGTIIKEISGSCSKEQLKTLSGQRGENENLE